MDTRHAHSVVLAVTIHAHDPQPLRARLASALPDAAAATILLRSASAQLASVTVLAIEVPPTVVASPSPPSDAAPPPSPASPSDGAPRSSSDGLVAGVPSTVVYLALLAMSAGCLLCAAACLTVACCWRRRVEPEESGPPVEYETSTVQVAIGKHSVPRPPLPLMKSRSTFSRLGEEEVSATSSRDHWMDVNTGRSPAQSYDGNHAQAAMDAQEAGGRADMRSSVHPVHANL